MNEKIPLLLDAAPTPEDTLAWLLAAASPQLSLLGITTGCGQPPAVALAAASQICTLLGLHLPLAQGPARPLLPPPNQSIPHLPTNSFPPDFPPVTTPLPLSPLAAPSFLATTLAQSSHPVALLSTGPLTNLAALLLAHPHLKPQIAGVYLVGGGLRWNDCTPAAQWNYYIDPQAAALVLTSGLPLTILPLDTTRQAFLLPAEIATIRRLGTPLAAALAQVLTQLCQQHQAQGHPGALLPHTAGVTALAAPHLLSTQPLYLAVETHGDYCRGALVADWYGEGGHPPNAQVARGIQREAWAALLLSAITAYHEVLA